MPALTISFVGILHGAAAIALGGVPTGKQYACEHARHAGIIRYMGCHRATTDISARTGNMTLATATLLEKSVMIEAHRHAITNTDNLGSFAKSASDVAIISLMPLALEPSARAKPPPSRKIRPQGIFCCTAFQVISGGEAIFGRLLSSLLKMLRNEGFEGMIKSSNTTINAAVASFTCKLKQKQLEINKKSIRLFLPCVA